MSFYFKRDVVVKISTEPNTTADDTNTIRLLVKNFSWRQENSISSKKRETFDPLSDRGATHFVESLSPISFSLTTYMIPMVSTNVTSPEEYLWIGLMGDPAGISSNPTSSTINFANGNVLDLHNLTIWFDQPFLADANYRLNNCVIDSARINFDIKGIAEIEWSGRALSLNLDNTPPTGINREGNLGYLKNKLSTIALNYDAVAMSLPLTSGSILFNNNNEFHGRTRLGEVTEPEGSTSGIREVSGEITCYLRTGAGESSDLFESIIADIDNADYESAIAVDAIINIGGTTAPRVQIVMPSLLLHTGKINFDEVYTTTIPFILQESSGSYVSVIYQMP